MAAIIVSIYTMSISLYHITYLANGTIITQLVLADSLAFKYLGPRDDVRGKAIDTALAVEVATCLA
jgi:hypothetical protein